MSFLDHPQTIKRKNAYFAALNSHRGFLSYFPSLFASYNKYIIKGGPGCGKSTLMKKIATAAEANGLAVTRYYCSSDTDSLDAVVIDSLKIVILDGTPPHAIEPACPGAVDSIVNLTAFWNHQQLKQSAKEIKALSETVFVTEFHDLKSHLPTVQREKVHAVQHAALYPLGDLIRYLRVGAMTPPKKHVCLI